MINPLALVGAELRRHAFGSLAMLLLLAFAFAASAAVSLFERGLRESGAAFAGDSDLVVGAPGNDLGLVMAAVYLQPDQNLPLVPGAVVDKLARDPRVAALSPIVYADHYMDFPIVGVGRDYPRLRAGLRLAAGRWPQAPFELVAGADAKLGLGQTIVSSHGSHAESGVEAEEHHEENYTVVGVLAPARSPADRCLYAWAESMWELHEHAEAGKADRAAPPSKADQHAVSAVLVKPRDFAAAYALRAEYRSDATNAVFPGEVLASLFAVFQELRDLLSWLGLAFQAVMLAAVLLSLLAGLPDRTRWIGLLRGLGAGRGYIFLSLWLPQALVFLAAGLAGAAAGGALAGALGAWVEGRSGLHVAIAWSATETLSLGLFWLAALLGALVPAWLGFRTSARSALLGQP